MNCAPTYMLANLEKIASILLAIFFAGDEVACIDILLMPDHGFGWKVDQFDAPGEQF